MGCRSASLEVSNQGILHTLKEISEHHLKCVNRFEPTPEASVFMSLISTSGYNSLFAYLFVDRENTSDLVSLPWKCSLEHDGGGAAPWRPLPN